MLTSITPLGERGRGNRRAITMTAYAVGSLLGGATTGLVLGSVGSALPELPVLLIAGLVCLAAAVADLGPWHLPGGHRQVDEDWLTRYRGWVYGAGFGYQLGLGIATVVTSAATYVVLVLALLTGSPWAGLAIGAVFGLARAVPALLLARADTHDEIRTMAAGLVRRARFGARSTAGALALGGAVLLAGSAL